MITKCSSVIYQNHELIIKQVTEDINNIPEIKIVDEFKYSEEDDLISGVIFDGETETEISYSGKNFEDLQKLQDEMNIDLSGIYFNRFAKKNPNFFEIPFRIIHTNLRVIEVNVSLPDLKFNYEFQINRLETENSKKIYDFATSKLFVQKIEEQLQLKANEMRITSQSRGTVFTRGALPIINDSKKLEQINPNQEKVLQLPHINLQNILNKV